ncbi:MAG TPA: LD-carboxypeptidase, partial [Bacillota bacterium]|nr:LD-carboxypeptidase [Bacillota bacterium]
MKAKRLKTGDTIGIVAPASPSETLKAERAIKHITDMGYSVKAGKSVYSSRGYLAGADELRASDINDMFADDEI